MAAALMTAVFVTPSLLKTFRRLQMVKAHGDANAAAGSGPVRIAGVARRVDATTVRSPTGVEGVAWVGVAGVMRPSKNGSVLVSSCHLGELGDVLVSNEVATFHLDLAHRGDRIVLATPGVLDAKDVVIDLGPPTEERKGARVPSVVRERCGDATPPTATIVYREGVLREGDRVEVLACRERTDVLVPCHDGLDLLTIGHVEQRVTALRAEATVILLLESLWNLIVFGMLGVICARAVVHTRLAAKEARANR
jgi:hypothetical protein